MFRLVPQVLTHNAYLFMPGANQWSSCTVYYFFFKTEGWSRQGNLRVMYTYLRTQSERTDLTNLKVFQLGFTCFYQMYSFISLLSWYAYWALLICIPTTIFWRTALSLNNSNNVVLENDIIMEWRGPEVTVVGKVLALGVELTHRKPELRMQEAGQVFSFSFEKKWTYMPSNAIFELFIFVEIAVL